MSLHTLFGKHVPDFRENHWEQGYFVSKCSKCGREMIRLPGMPWRIREASH